MATRIKRVLCLLLAAATLCSAVPGNMLYAAEMETTTAEQDADDAEAEDSDAAGNGETVLEDGEVVMDGAVGKVDESEWITIEDYKQIAESDKYIMYFYEPRLSFILEDKETGKYLESTLSDEKDDGNSNASWNAYMKSGIVLSAIVGTINTYQVDLISCENTIDVEYLENGFSAKVYFKEYEFGLTVQVVLDGEDVVVTVPDDSIVENKEGTYISTVSLYPFLGYTFLDDQDGYMLIPDGNGALIYLDNKEGRYSTGFSQMIYGKDDGFVQSDTSSYLWERYQTVIDANEVIAPIFGMAHTEEQLGYLAVVEQGDERASIEAHPNGVMVNYNRCFAKFLVRDIYIQPLNQSNSGTVTNVEADRLHSDLSVRYMLVDQEEANYSGMAVRYRNYLLDNGIVEVKDTSYKSRVDFLGTDREEFLLGTKAVVMTTVDDIRDIYDELQSAGVKNVLSVYKGWQKGGLYNLPISKYRAERKIGGNSALTKLIEDSSEEGYEVYLYNDALQVNAKTNATTFNVVKMVNKRTLKLDTNGRVYDTFYYLMPGKAQTNLQKFVESYTKKGVNNLALTGITNTLYSYSQRGTYYGRTDTKATYTDAIASIDESTDLILENPAQYLWKYTDAFLDMPMESSDYMYVNEDVPFLSIVLKGIIPMYSDYVNFEANKTEFFLQMVESGVYPSFFITKEDSSDLIYTNSSHLYSTEYTGYKNTIIAYDEELSQVAEKVAGACIEKHEKLESGVTKVTYDNGVVIYINYSAKNVTVDGMEVEALSYKVGE